MPSLNFLKNSATLFEIRLEKDLIVLRGSENEAASQMLRGAVVLCLPSPLKIEDVYLRMAGITKIALYHPRSSHSPPHGPEQTRQTFNHSWPPFLSGGGKGSSSKSSVLSAGNYEWPFELIIPGSLPESVEGLEDANVLYKLKATVARGRMAQDLHTQKPVRIIRTLDPAALELAHAMTVENIWPNKVEYSLSIPQKAVIFGTGILIEMRFTSLLKGLKIGKITCNLVESHDWMQKLHGGEIHAKKSRNIGTWSFEMNEEENYQDMMNEAGQDGWVLKDSLPLPKSLKRCMQDVDTEGIKIRHKVKFVIALENPDGHTSELRASLPVTIFISPNLPVDESGNLVEHTPNGLSLIDIDTHAPPLYGDHLLDQLYADMDPSGSRTPAAHSGMNTPLYNRSRSGSEENVSAGNAEAGTDIRPDALSSRLQNLDGDRNGGLRNGSIFFRRGNGSASGGNTPLSHGHSSTVSMQHSSAIRGNPLSRRTSEEEIHEGQQSGATSGRHTPEHIDYSEVDLSKVPSYTTALRSPARGMSYTDAEALPNYQAAMSAPPSPQAALSNLATVSEASTSEINDNNNMS